jgi:hypothetical protein
MKQLLLVATLALSGCVSTRTCELRTQRAVGKTLLEDQTDAKDATEQVMIAWQLREDMLVRNFCLLVIQDSIQISKLQKKNGVQLPRICGPIYEALLQQK